MQNRIKMLVETLNKASDAYYNEDSEIMSNFEYDQLYDKLVALEMQTGIILPNSPTQHAGMNIDKDKPKITHETPALSLAKTKDISLFPKTFAVQDNLAVIMWKEDGGTLIATYDNGKLTSLATRGNGLVGQDITHNAPFIHGLPMTIPYDKHLVIRSEAVMSYEEYERINNNLPANVEPYKNARNLANSTVSLSAEKKLEHRNIWSHAFKLVTTDDATIPRTFDMQLDFLESMGFATTEHQICHVNCLEQAMLDFSKRITEYPFPVDGLVVAANDVTYAESQPGTGHNPNKLVGFALKWKDETVETTLRDIEWSPSRTGLLNPVAIFDPIEIEGTIVSRASLHNVSTLRKLQLRIGDRITVYKANKIIPQIADNLTKKGLLSDTEAAITLCPCCHEPVTVLQNTQKNTIVETAVCFNPKCPAKHVSRYTHFVERNSMNITGLSKATITTFINRGWITEFADIYHLDKHKDEIINTDGFGEKSYKNIIKAVNKSRKTTFVPFITALGIPNISDGKARVFAKEYNHDVHAFLQDIHATAFPSMQTSTKDFSAMNNIGPILKQNLITWGQTYLAYMHTNIDVNLEIQQLLQELQFEIPVSTNDTGILQGLTFVITGDVHHYKNRNEMKNHIESLGGKVSGSVSSKTNYLINNNLTSTSEKNKKAQMLNIPIISETEFLSMLK